MKYSIQPKKNFTSAVRWTFNKGIKEFKCGEVYKNAKLIFKNNPSFFEVYEPKIGICLNNLKKNYGYDKFNSGNGPDKQVIFFSKNVSKRDQNILSKIYLSESTYFSFPKLEQNGWKRIKSEVFIWGEWIVGREKTKIYMSSPFETHYQLEITKKEYLDYLKNGVSGDKFEEIRNDIYDHETIHGCIADKNFKTGYHFNFSIDDKPVKGISTIFKNLYKNSLEKFKNKSDSLGAVLNPPEYFSVYYPTSYNSVGLGLEIDGDFDINLLSLEIESIKDEYSGKCRDTFFPYYAGERFDWVDSDDQDGQDWYLIGSKGEIQSLDINSDDESEDHDD